MLRKTGVTMLALICLATALNVGILILNVSMPSEAAVAGLHYRGLLRDPDFRRAVQVVVEACRVNLNLADIRC
jgi:hypothetical protein